MYGLRRTTRLIPGDNRYIGYPDINAYDSGMQRLARPLPRKLVMRARNKIAKFMRRTRDKMRFNRLLAEGAIRPQARMGRGRNTWLNKNVRSYL